MILKKLPSVTGWMRLMNCEIQTMVPFLFVIMGMKIKAVDVCLRPLLSKSLASKYVNTLHPNGIWAA